MDRLGAEYARNAVGGAISVITEAPSFDDVATSLQASYGNYDDLQTKAQVNIPLTETLAIGLSGIYTAQISIAMESPVECLCPRRSPKAPG